MQKSKNFKPIIIIPGDIDSIFFEIFIKSLKKIKIKSPIILVGSKKLLISNMKRYGLKKKINILTPSLKREVISNKAINVINVEIKKISKKKNYNDISDDYLKKCFEISLKILKSGFTNKFINGPISKGFLKKKFFGITEYLANEFKIKNFAMLIFNRNLSVCPLTTHLPLKEVSVNISKKKIFDKVKLIDNFYSSKFKFKPKIAITGLNPHCESVDKYNEDIKIIKPAIQKLKKLKYNVNGPFAADTIFTKINRKKFNVIIGMYHDQVIAPLKSLYEFDAINITLGLPIARVSPDHGPNIEMVGRNISDPSSLIKSIKFLDY